MEQGTGKSRRYNWVAPRVGAWIETLLYPLAFDLGAIVNSRPSRGGVDRNAFGRVLRMTLGARESPLAWGRGSKRLG